jgi:hypothetical protein
MLADGSKELRRGTVVSSGRGNFLFPEFDTAGGIHNRRRDDIR